MKLNLVQPKIADRPNLGVELINQFCQEPSITTNSALLATVPVISSTDNSFAKQLPSHTITAIVSQQAVTNGSTTTNEKNSKGIIQGTIAGITVSQLSNTSTIMKPGVSKFINDIKTKYPKIPDEKIITPAMFTGQNGIKDLSTLKNNVSAQIKATTDSIVKATNGLTSKGVLTGKESPTEVSGVIMAAAAIGASTVANIIKNPKAIPTLINSNTDIKNLISNGNFAGKLADKVSSGLAGVETGIKLLATNIQTNLNDIATNTKSIASNALQFAEKSFSDLKNGLSKLSVGVNKDPLSSNNQIIQNVIAAEKELNQTKLLLKVENNSANIEAVRTAEKNLAAMQQQAEKFKKILTTTGTNISNQIGNTIQNLSNAGVTAVTNFSNSIEKGVSSVASNVKSLFSENGIQNQLGNLKNNAMKLATKTLSPLASKATSLLNSIGNAGGKLKIPSAASNTFFSVKKSMESTLNTVLDPKVPLPKFDNIIGFTPPKEEDYSIIESKLKKINSLTTELEAKSNNIDAMVSKYIINKDPSLLAEIERLSVEITTSKTKLAEAQVDYANSIMI